MSAPKVTVTGWSNKNDVSDGYAYGSGKLIQRQVEKFSGGLGVWSPGDNSWSTHSVDNLNHIDSVLLYFGGTPVTMEQIKFNWYDGDSDFTLAAYTDGHVDLTTMKSNLEDIGYSEMTTEGWSIINSYTNAKYDITDVNSGNISSSYWLVSALNPSLGGGDISHSNDRFKLKYIGGSKPDRPPVGVPEPSTLLLLGGALLVVAMRRKLLQGRHGLCAVEA